MNCLHKVAIYLSNRQIYYSYFIVDCQGLVVYANNFVFSSA